MTLQGITEDEIANYLVHTPGFFERNAQLLASIQLTSPHGQRAVSLQERQMDVMREKYRLLEQRMTELIAVAQDNAAIANKFHAWTQALLTARHDADLAQALIDGLRANFSVPQATLRMWDVAPDYVGAWFARDVSDDARIFAASLLSPYCGSNHDFEAVRWLDDPDSVASTVILPLREGANAFGLLILGSPDPERFAASMGTDFLVHIGETASAALAALRA